MLFREPLRVCPCRIIESPQFFAQGAMRMQEWLLPPMQTRVTSWTKLFATNEVQFTDNSIDNFLAFVDRMSCSADAYISLGGSNGCADQLTNWDGTQKVGLGAIQRKKPKGYSL
jgi:hypothetical protein